MIKTNGRVTGPTGQTILGAWGLFSALLLVMLGTNMLATVIGIRAELVGFSTSVTGAVLSLNYLGFLLAAWISPRLVVTVGHIRVYAALASLCSSASLLYAVTDSPWVWGAARLTSGFTLSGMLIVAESWLNDSTTNESRGRVLSIYMVVLTGGMAASQLLLTVADPNGIVIFIVSSLLISVGIIPITLSATPSPDFQLVAKLSFRTIWEAAPVGVVAGLGQGLGVGAFLSLAAVYGARVGMSVGMIALFVSIAIIGALVLQTPIGIISDRVRRRRLISMVALLASLTSVWMVFADPTGWTALIISFLLGGLTLPLYALALSHINDVVPPGSAVSVSSIYLFITGVGAFLGPIIAAPMMDWLGPTGLFWTMAGIFLAVTLFALVLVLTKEGLSVEQQRAFTMVPARTGAIVLQMARRVRHPSEMIHRKPKDEPRD